MAKVEVNIDSVTRNGWGERVESKRLIFSLTDEQNVALFIDGHTYEIEFSEWEQVAAVLYLALKRKE